MTYLSERTDHAQGGELSPSPEPHPAAGPPVIQFVPIEGERLEHLATERRGPLRWTASAVLSVQALMRKGPSAPVLQEAEAEGPAATSAPPARTVPEPMPGSGWSWNADDEQSWEAWEANVTAGDTDRRLASLDTDLERPLPAPVRLAQLLGGRRLSRRSGRRGPAPDDD